MAVRFRVMFGQGRFFLECSNWDSEFCEKMVRCVVFEEETGLVDVLNVERMASVRYVSTV